MTLTYGVDLRTCMNPRAECPGQSNTMTDTHTRAGRGLRPSMGWAGLGWVVLDWVIFDL